MDLLRDSAFAADLLSFVCDDRPLCVYLTESSVVRPDCDSKSGFWLGFAIDIGQVR